MWDVVVLNNLVGMLDPYCLKVSTKVEIQRRLTIKPLFCETNLQKRIPLAKRLPEQIYISGMESQTGCLMFTFVNH